ncbi:MAG: glutathione S-transferase family protein [Phenylobacterium sp.]|uniref:glutathione S-transferase family protein n=1 Tax=Phenylobacterium sp. TaxID=1871053 RepID=UPI00391B1D90
MMKLFYSVGSCSLASHIALEEAGADYEAVRLNLAAGEQRTPEYLAINPKGRVPALVTERGVLTETPAILAFIAQAHPAAGLAPLDDPFAFAELQSFNAYICSTVHPAYAHWRRGTRWADEDSSIEDMKRRAPKNMADEFAAIEASMFRGPWMMGADYSVADPYLFTLASWLGNLGVNLGDFPKVAEHQARMRARPAVSKVLAVHAA